MKALDFRKEFQTLKRLYFHLTSFTFIASHKFISWIQFSNR